MQDFFKKNFCTLIVSPLDIHRKPRPAKVVSNGEKRSKRKVQQSSKRKMLKDKVQAASDFLHSNTNKKIFLLPLLNIF